MYNLNSIKKLGNFIRDIVNFSLNKGISRHAKALTYSSVLALVPLLTIFLSTFAKSSWINSARDGLKILFLQNLFPEKIADTIGNYFISMAHTAQTFKLLSLVGFVIIILFLFMDMEDTFVDLVQQEQVKKKWYFRITTIFSLLIMPLILFILIAILDWILQHSPSVVKSVFDRALEYPEFLKSLAGFFLWMWILILYRFLPHKKLSLKCLMFGSLLGTVSILLLQQLFSWYLQIFKYYELIYGVFSIIPVFLIWMYLMWQLVLHSFVIALFCDIYQIKKTKNND